MQTLFNYIQAGGNTMYILLAFNIIGLTTIIYKLIQVHYFKYKQENAVKEIIDNIDKSLSLSMQKSLIEDGIIIKVSSLDYGLNTIKTIASIAPLLGLLGTVLGVLFSFESISKNGLGDPSVFASGISLALITTIGGLIVAIPHYIAYNHLASTLDKIEVELKKNINNILFKEK